MYNASKDARMLQVQCSQTGKTGGEGEIEKWREDTVTADIEKIMAKETVDHTIPEESKIRGSLIMTMIITAETKEDEVMIQVMMVPGKDSARGGSYMHTIPAAHLPPDW